MVTPISADRRNRGSSAGTWQICLASKHTTKNKASVAVRKLTVSCGGCHPTELILSFSTLYCDQTLPQTFENIQVTKRISCAISRGDTPHSCHNVRGATTSNFRKASLQDFLK